MMEAVRTSETSVHFKVTTRRYNPEGSKLHTRHRENVKSQEKYPLRISTRLSAILTRCLCVIQSFQITTNALQYLPTDQSQSTSWHIYLVFKPK
jgi:hypothetical protein